ncbi:pilin N-terminal domain-containing protein [Trueperella pyogenes]|uniref:pilin N-terminal domain-containing protein n=1 Tax=Trueperella pyogenes TaxID=1661 RepID=UPI003DA7CDA1
MVAPFLVTLPFPHKDGWIYDAHVYPKNELSKDPSTTKKAVDPKQMTQEGSQGAVHGHLDHSGRAAIQPCQGDGCCR